MEEDLFRAVVFLVILYAVFRLAQLIMNIIRESRKRPKDGPPKDP